MGALPNALERKITFITTGGTIDKRYGAGKGVENYTFGKDPALLDILKQMRIKDDPKHGLVADLVRIEPLDSLQMDSADRAKIVTACLNSFTRAVVITHGTDTMIETARAISRHQLQKAVVLTGASLPASDKMSDAATNVAFAIAYALREPYGVYIAMHGVLHPWDECEKIDTGEFIRTQHCCTA